MGGYNVNLEQNRIILEKHMKNNRNNNNDCASG